MRSAANLPYCADFSTSRRSRSDGIFSDRIHAVLSLLYKKGKALLSDLLRILESRSIIEICNIQNRSEVLWLSIEKAKKHLAKFGAEGRVLEFDTSSATVELAAQAVGCEPARIAKTLSFRTHDGVILIVAAGDAKVDNAKYKARFGCKAKMLTVDEVEAETGHQIGGVCPFGINEGVAVYLDESLRRFETVYPACGSSNSAIELSLAELEKFSESNVWVDVCKGWRNV